MRRTLLMTVEVVVEELPEHIVEGDDLALTLTAAMSRAEPSDAVVKDVQLKAYQLSARFESKNR